jgi:hypothetical protein
MRWRLLGGVEGITGVLMFRWSIGTIFAVVRRLLTMRIERNKIAAGHSDKEDHHV